MPKTYKLKKEVPITAVAKLGFQIVTDNTAKYYCEHDRDIGVLEYHPGSRNFVMQFDLVPQRAGVCYNGQESKRLLEQLKDNFVRVEDASGEFQSILEELVRDGIVEVEGTENGE